MIDTNKYEGHTLAEEWGNIVYADGYLSIFLDDDVYATDTDRQLMADAPLLLEQVKILTRTLELIGKNMKYDPWMHTLIKDVIGFEKWQVKEMKKND